MSPASVDDPEPRLIYRFINIEEALVLQNAQRDKAEGRNGEVCSVSNLFSQPVLHLIDQPDGLDRVISSLSRQPDNERIGWEPVVLVEDSCAVVDYFLPFARAEGFHLQRQVFADELGRSCLESGLYNYVIVIVSPAG